MSLGLYHIRYLSSQDSCWNNNALPNWLYYQISVSIQELENCHKLALPLPGHMPKFKGVHLGWVRLLQQKGLLVPLFLLSGCILLAKLKNSLSV